MTAEHLPLADTDPTALPQIYVACPLTDLTGNAKRALTAEVPAVKRAIESLTVGDRPEGEAWPVRVYAPADHTAPWKNDGIDPSGVFRRNIQEVFGSDALIVLAEQGASAGVGQELEWAATIGLPILYLTSSGKISRQILGAPAFLTHVTYEDNDQLEVAVKDFLRRWKPLILDGPRRRHARRLRFEAVGVRLRQAWNSVGDPTGVAAQCRVTTDYLDLMLADAGLTAVMPAHVLLTLARELNVPVAPFIAERERILPIPALRALFAAAAKDGWSDSEVGLLMSHGIATLLQDDESDLTTMTAWRRLRRTLRAV